MEKVPCNIREAVDFVKSELVGKAYDLAMSDPKTFCTRVHHTYGRWIRNEWGLWGGSELKNEFLKLGVIHPDDMSSYILNTAVQELKDVSVKNTREENG